MTASEKQQIQLKTVQVEKKQKYSDSEKWHNSSPWESVMPKGKSTTKLFWLIHECYLYISPLEEKSYTNDLKNNWLLIRVILI